MQRNRKIEATCSKKPKYINGPSYAEELKRIKTSHDQIKPLMARKESCVRNRLATEFWMPVEIIDEYLCFGEYLSMEVLKTLAELRINKDFFDRAQKVKRQLLKIYRHDKLSDQKITSNVSQSMLDMYHEYFEKGKIKTNDWKRFLKGEDGIEDLKKRKPNKSTGRKSKKFKYWAGAIEPSEARPVNLNDIDKMLNDVRHGIQNINIFDSVKLCMRVAKVKKQCLGLAKIYSLMLEMERKQSRNQQKDFA